MGQIESRLGGSPLEEVALRHIGALIAEVQGNAMVTSFVLLVNTTDGDDRWLSSFVAPGQKAWETMGIIEYGRQVEANAATCAPYIDDEDD